MPPTLYRARRILTMNASHPEATHVAVRDGRVLGVGDAESLAGWGPFTIDDRFADRVLLPGFVEAHSHVSEGGFWRHPYVGFHDRVDPEGRRWPGLTTLDAVLGALTTYAGALSDPEQPLVAWGFDPIFLPGERCTRQHLDRVSARRPVVVMHASGHILSVNGAALTRVGWLRTGVDHPGIPLDAAGLPAGELKGPEAMTPMLERCAMGRDALADEGALRRFAALCLRSGTTTATDLLNTLTPDIVETMLRVTGEPTFPARIVPFLRLIGEPVPESIARAIALRAQSTERLRLGAVKIVTDGSIQGYSARLRWPGYFDGSPNGLWYVAPERLRQALRAALDADLPVHLHTNGDQATELVLETMRSLLSERFVPDHRYTLQHCQLADAAQFRMMRTLGMCVNLFANHTYYWGDAHRTLTVGPERAERMNACATALACGVPLAIHSDAPVTPLGPLFTAWCAINRLTSSGRLLGANERIPVGDALRAITLGAAWQLRLDGEIGSIECGKRADFAVLEDDPLTVRPEALREIRVWGTVLGGVPQPAP
jgi:predicted amidohydrolase YtcJ